MSPSRSCRLNAGDSAGESKWMLNMPKCQISDVFSTAASQANNGVRSALTNIGTPQLLPPPVVVTLPPKRPHQATRSATEISVVTLDRPCSQCGRPQGQRWLPKTGARNGRRGISHEFSDAALCADIRLLRQRERRWRKSGRRRALYRYLELVFELFTAWRKEAPDGPPLSSRLESLMQLSPGQTCSPIRAIIESTSKAGRKSKSRWTRALRYAWRVRKDYKTLQHCLWAHGGVAGCAREWADVNGRRDRFVWLDEE